MYKNLKRSRKSEQDQPRFKKRFQTQNGPSAPKLKHEKWSGSQDGKPTCATCGKKHYGECLLSTGSCFGCGKYGHKLRDFPTRDGDYVSPDVPKDDAPKKSCFYALGTREAKLDEGDDDDGKFLYFSF